MTSPRLRTAAPWTRVSPASLAANLESASVGASDVGDLRRDAWGHGLLVVGRALRHAGVGAVVVDAVDRAIAEDLGFVVTDAVPTVPMGRILGLEGGAPVMSLRARVLSTKPLREGEGVSYGYIHRAAADTRVALVPGGYAQGVVRALGNSVHVDIRGRRRRIVGRVAMDVCVVDVGSHGDVVPGDEVVFFGDGAVRDELVQWASATGLRPGELAARVGLGTAREVAG
ncbi:alanine racemase C-terminal domain-containing protein [Microbacterium sp. NPDC055683]